MKLQEGDQKTAETSVDHQTAMKQQAAAHDLTILQTTAAHEEKLAQLTAAHVLVLQRLEADRVQTAAEIERLQRAKEAADTVIAEWNETVRVSAQALVAEAAKSDAEDEAPQHQETVTIPTTEYGQLLKDQTLADTIGPTLVTHHAAVRRLEEKLKKAEAARNKARSRLQSIRTYLPGKPDEESMSE